MKRAIASGSAWHSAAKTRVATLIKDPEFESLARDNFVVAQVPPQDAAAEPAEGAAERSAEGAETGFGLFATDDLAARAA